METKHKLSLGPLGSLNQVVRALGKTIRAMGDGTIETHDGARIANALGIMRACLETMEVERLHSRLDEIEAQEPNASRPAVIRYDYDYSKRLS